MLLRRPEAEGRGRRHDQGLIHAAAIHASFLLALDSEPARICCGPEDLQFTKDARSPAVCISGPLGRSQGTGLSPLILVL